ncbi:MAG: hypothetical protein K8J08_13330 [Thermoanaerobaculia bacterium]|nr:hypothetical protein [Thermoanaerobaculia bacterium]
MEQKAIEDPPEPATPGNGSKELFVGAQGGIWKGLRSRLPDLITQASFVFLAVLLALAAEEWRSNRDRQELADRALEGIHREIDANRAQLMKDKTRLEDINVAFGRDPAQDSESGVQINYQYALLSTSAWEAARMSQAVNIMDLERTTGLASVYDIQQVFASTQNDLMKGLGRYGIAMRENPEIAELELERLLRTTIGYREVLLQVYDGYLQGSVD